jgi:hypothetical protein
MKRPQQIDEAIATAVLLIAATSYSTLKNDTAAVAPVGTVRY